MMGVLRRRGQHTERSREDRNRNRSDVSTNQGAPRISGPHQERRERGIE